MSLTPEEVKQRRAEARKKYLESDKGKAKRAEWLAKNKDRLEAYHRGWVRQNLKTAASYLREWRQTNKEKYNAQINEWQKNNRDKVNAYRKLYRAIKSGKVQRQYVCQDCGSKASRIDAHHEDYSKPLDVLWLCRQCHRNRHPVKHSVTT
jgi:hypothetical protein